MPDHPQGKVPLERALSKLGVASRSNTRAWIAEGKIRVNGRIVRDPQFPVVPETARIEVDGQPVHRSGWRTILLNKPRGVVTTRSDEKGRPTIYSLLKESDRHLHPVGRLDMATSGLLLLTTDTQLSNRLTDPKQGIVRTYIVEAKGLVTEAELERLRGGIVDRGEKLQPKDIVLRKTSQRESHLTVKLTEGKNREIRRMFESIGHDVLRLKRVAFGPFELGDLSPGAYREVSFAECKF